jgi:hypothetical protein
MWTSPDLGDSWYLSKWAGWGGAGLADRSPKTASPQECCNELSIEISKEILSLLPKEEK